MNLCNMKSGTKTSLWVSHRRVQRASHRDSGARTRSGDYQPPRRIGQPGDHTDGCSVHLTGIQELRVEITSHREDHTETSLWVSHRRVQRASHRDSGARTRSGDYQPPRRIGQPGDHTDGCSVHLTGIQELRVEITSHREDHTDGCSVHLTGIQELGLEITSHREGSVNLGIIPTGAACISPGFRS